MQDFLNINRGGAVQSTEFIGGGRELFDSGVYNTKIKQAYLDQYDSGARFCSVTLEINGKDYEERLLLTNAKGEGFWTDRDGNPQQFGGLTRLDELSFAAGFPNTQASGINPGIIRAWDKDAKAFVLRQHATVLTGITGKQVQVALIKLTQNKQKKNLNTGKYDKLNEREDINQIDKFANLSKQTQLEAVKNINPPMFMDTWSAKWTGNIKDTFKKQTDASTQGTPTAGNAAPATDLFT